DQRAVRPRTGPRHVEMIASGLGRKLSARADPGAEARVLAHEAPAGRGGVVPLVHPPPARHIAHGQNPSCSPCNTKMGPGGPRNNRPGAQFNVAPSGTIASAANPKFA